MINLSRPRGRGRLGSVLVAAALLAGACAEIDQAELEALLTDEQNAEFTGRDRSNTTTPRGEPDPAVSTTTAEVDRGDRVRPVIERRDCPFDSSDVTDVLCGDVELPGRGADPDYTVTISVARFFATGEADDVRADPVVYLHGGPGGSILTDATFWYASIVEPHLAHRDVILYDQRGGGDSTNLPRCHEASAVSDRFYVEEIDHTSLTGPFLDGLEACAEKYRDRTDVDLTAYNSRIHAEDLSDLLWALDVETYNLHGSSYGTRLAQTMLRDQPEGIRSVVLSGAYPIEANLMGSVPVSLESSLTAVFDACAADPVCAEALPDPWRALEDLVAELDRDPLEVTAAETLERSTTLQFDGTDLLNGLHQMLYVGREAATLPDLLIDHLDGDDGRLRRLARSSVFDVTDVAAFILVQCADEGGFTTAHDLARPIEHEFLRVVDQAPSLNGADSLEVCATWDTGEPDPTENDPVTWDAPTLFLSGVVDPITPPDWARALATRLPRGRLVVLADRSHDSDEGWCALGIMTDFIDRPDVPVDSTCAANAELEISSTAGRFRGATETVDLTLDVTGVEPFELQVPDWLGDWRDDRHLRWRDLDPFDVTALVITSDSTDYPFIEHLGFSGFALELEEAPAPWVPAGWTRSVADTAAGLVVRYQHAGFGLRLALVADADEPADLERTVLVPAAASVVPEAS